MVSIHYFASIRESLGSAGEEIELPGDVGTVAELMDYLIARGPHWRDTLGNPAVLVALNQDMVKRDAAVGDGDEIAFLPPVTGG